MSLPVPPPASDDDAALEARVRRKSAVGEPLTAEERAFLARAPGTRMIPADVVRESAARHGGPEPHRASEHPEDAPNPP